MFHQWDFMFITNLSLNDLVIIHCSWFWFFSEHIRSSDTVASQHLLNQSFSFISGPCLEVSFACSIQHCMILHINASAELLQQLSLCETMMWTVPLVSPKSLPRTSKSFSRSLRECPNLIPYRFSSSIIKKFNQKCRPDITPGGEISRWQVSQSSFRFPRERMFEHLADDVVCCCFILMNARHIIL